jgi:chromate transporter
MQGGGFRAAALFFERKRLIFPLRALGTVEHRARCVVGSWPEIFWVFLRLGCASFGGPAAHLGYFRSEFVERRRWIDEAAYAELIALSQALPGPGSSQVGFAIGLLRGGWWGGLAAWLGFTLPSALLMVGLAVGASEAGWLLRGGPVVHVLAMVAVAVVLQAVLAMRAALAPDARRLTMAGVSFAVIFAGSYASARLGLSLQPLVLLVAAMVGAALLRQIPQSTPAPTAQETAFHAGHARVAGLLVAVLLVVTVLAATAFWLQAQLFAAFARSGSLVFGGGHVVLPMLEQAVVARGWLPQPVFLAGYGAVQAVPGPLFTFAGYLGAAIGLRSGGQVAACALAALVGIFAPGLLLMAALLGARDWLRGSPRVRAALAGVNAAVVGLLAAALVRPLATETIHTALDALGVCAAFAALRVRWVQPWMVVLLAMAIGLLQQTYGIAR